MLAKRILDQLRRRWRGPGLRVLVNGHTYQLGDEPGQTELAITRPTVLHRLALSPSLAFGEAYMRGEIVVEGRLMDVLQGFHQTAAAMAATLPGRIARRLGRLPERTGVHQAVANASHHYDIGNDFYRLWLDPSLTYSCAYFLSDHDELATAQAQKLELLCRKARLEQGQTLLDVGCGWGGLLLHAAECHGVEAVGLTPAHEQAEYIETEAARRGLAQRVRVVRGDWRQIDQRFDRVISVGMFEHVGLSQYRAFFERWRRWLGTAGLSVLHTIGRMQVKPANPWIRRYIFPGGYLPALSQITHHTAEAGLWLTDLENLGQHYARTLACWSANFLDARDQIVQMYDETFARMWWLYLQSAEAAFRWGGLHLWQAVLAGDEHAPWPLNREVNVQQLADSIVG